MLVDTMTVRCLCVRPSGFSYLTITIALKNYHNSFCMSAGSTCRLHASQTLKWLSCISTYGIGEPSKLLTKTGFNSCYQQSDIIQAVNKSVPASL